jgi:hypothetical protein
MYLKTKFFVYLLMLNTTLLL